MLNSGKKNLEASATWLHSIQQSSMTKILVIWNGPIQRKSIVATNEYK